MYIFLVLVFNILLFAENDGKKTENEPVEESVFADVVKNITRVNNVLEDLIKNYKKLKKMYQSEETFEENYSLDTENDKVNQRGKNEVKIKQKSTTKSGDLATQMFISEEKKKASEENEIEGIDDSREKERKPNFEYLKKLEEVPSNSDNQTDSNDSQTDVYSYDSQTDSNSFENSASSEESKDVNETVKASDQLEPSGVSIENTKPKFHAVKVYKNKTHSNTTSDMRDGPIKVSLLNNSNAVWKIELSNIFSQNNAVDEYVTNNPEDLRKGSDPNITAGWENKEKKIRSVASENENDVTSNSKESIEERQKLEKEEFKTKILRKAYGDACLKVVVNKCYKACKSSLTNACRTYRCDKDFKDQFKENSKKGCVQEFKEFPNNVTTLADNGFIDISRNGYLAAACLPKTHEGTVQNSNNVGEDLTILQNRFERACQHISSKKCDSACNYAVTETCSIHPCDEIKEIRFKKDCEKECRDTYVSVSNNDNSDIELDNIKKKDKKETVLKDNEFSNDETRAQNKEETEEHVKQKMKKGNKESYKKKEHLKMKKKEFSDEEKVIKNKGIPKKMKQVIKKSTVTKKNSTKRAHYRVMY